MKVTNDLLTTSDKRLVSVLALLDVSATFNIIDDQRLEHFTGIKGLALNWFKSYLSDQCQLLHIDDKSSIYSKVSQSSKRSCACTSSIHFYIYIYIYVCVCVCPLGNIIRKQSMNFQCCTVLEVSFVIWVSVIGLCAFQNSS